MNFDSIVDDIIRREGGSKATNDPNDRGGRTQFGVSERSFPNAWLDHKVTEQEARDIYLNKFIKYPGFDKISDSHEAVVRQLVDWSVTSGPYIPVTKLQEILGVTADGKLGPKTLATLVSKDVRVVNNALVKERILMISRICQRSPSQVKWLGGWCIRAMDFLI